MGTLVRAFGTRPPGSGGLPVWLRRAAGLLLALAVLAGAAVFADRSLLHFWHQIGPVYRNHSLGSRLDFSWFFYGMQTAFQHAAPAVRLYDVAAQDLWMQAHGFPYDHADMFGYPPPFALLFSPLAALPYAAARQLWTQINLAALAVGIGVAVWHAGPRLSIGRRLVLAGGALWFAPLFSNFFYGQPNTLVLALVALGLWAIMRERPQRWAAILGGVAIGLAAVLKLTPAVVLGYLPVRWLLSRRSDRGHAALLGAVAGWVTVAAACGASALAFGWSILGTYIHQAIPAVERSAWAHGAAPWNQSFRGILMVWPHPAHWLTHASDAFAAGVFLLALVPVALRPRLDPRLEAAVACLLILLCSPSLENHHFTVAILPWILLGGYLLDRGAGRPGLRSLALLPLAAAFAVATVALVAPAHLRWPTALLHRTVSVPVPAGSYDRVYLLGGASFGPVRFNLGLRYRGAPAGSIPADWPDWWSPGKTLQPAVRGEAIASGRVANASVGLYAFGYAVRSGAPLAALELPTALPQQNGGQEALHIVAVTLRRASPVPQFVDVPLPYNARGIVPSVGARVPQALTFDGVGSVFFSPAWPHGTFTVVIGATAVPFSLPAAGAGANVLSAPAPGTATAAAAPAGKPRLLQVVLSHAPYFVGIVLLFVAAWAAAATDTGAGGEAEAYPRPAAAEGRG